MRTIAFGQDLHVGGWVVQYLVCQRQHRVDIIGDVIGIRASARGPENQAICGPVGRFMRDFEQPVPFFLVADTARDIGAGCAWRHDGIAAFEQQLLGDGNGLAGFSIAGYLHKNGLPGCEPLDLAQKSRAVGRFQKHPPLPLDRTIRDGAVDRAGARAVAVDQKVIQLAVHNQRGGFDVAKMVQNDRTALHEVSPAKTYPAARSRFAVSASGRPTMPVNDPLIHGIRAPAGP